MHDYEFEENQKVVVVCGGFKVDEDMLENLRQIASVFGLAIENLANELYSFAQSVAEIFSVTNELLAEEIDRECKREMHKLDFTRPKIQHQVLCRKPKLVRKIIH